jgi:hypothetical protein
MVFYSWFFSADGLRQETREPSRFLVKALVLKSELIPNPNDKLRAQFFLQLFLAGKVAPTARLMFSGLPSPRK